MAIFGRIAGQFLALLLGQVRCRRTLDDLLVAALDGTVALEQMHDIAMGIAQNLAFDVTGTLDQLFEIDLVLAERGHRLALGFGHFRGQILRVANGAHAAPAAAPGCLEHHGIADLFGHSGDDRHVVRKRFGRRHDRNADLDRKIARRHLVAEPAHRIAASGR